MHCWNLILGLKELTNKRFHQIKLSTYDQNLGAKKVENWTSSICNNKEMKEIFFGKREIYEFVKTTLFSNKFIMHFLENMDFLAKKQITLKCWQTSSIFDLEVAFIFWCLKYVKPEN